jgi:hypothetical protein
MKRAAPSPKPPARRPKASARGPKSPDRTPVAPDVLRDAERTLDRLAGEVAQCIARLQGVDGPRALARAVNADVSLCQRVLTGVRARGRPSERLAVWPGAAGVELFSERLQRALGGVGTGSLALAVTAYAALIRSLATSHARAVRALRSMELADAKHNGVSGAVPAGSEGMEARKKLTRAVTELLGYSIDAATFVCAVRPLPDRAELIEGCSAVAITGLRSQGTRVCITSQNTQLRQVAGDLASETKWTPLGEPLTPGGRDGLLADFSSRPVPLTAMDEGDGVIRQVVEPHASSLAASGVDIVLARHWSPDNNPQFTSTPSWSQILRVRHPARRMVMDVYLHRSMLTPLPPTVGAYYWHPALASDPRKQWNDRFPGIPGVSVLQAGMPAPTPAWSRQGELTSKLFELSGWVPSDFIGFRCDEPFPIWGAAYYMTFDLSPR